MSSPALFEFDQFIEVHNSLARRATQYLRLLDLRRQFGTNLFAFPAKRYVLGLSSEILSQSPVLIYDRIRVVGAFYRAARGESVRRDVANVPAPLTIKNYIKLRGSFRAERA